MIRDRRKMALLRLLSKLRIYSATREINQLSILRHAAYGGFPGDVLVSDGTGFVKWTNLPEVIKSGI